MAPRSTLDASKFVLTTGAGCLVFARAHLGFVPWEFVPSVFSAFGSSIWGTSTGDRKSTRLNSSHANISYAVFCLKKKKTNEKRRDRRSSYSEARVSVMKM